MVRRAAFVLLWVLATLVATGVGLAAVRGVADQVVDEPSSHLLPVATTTTVPEELRALAVPPAEDGTQTSADDEAFPEAPPPQPPETTSSTTIANEQVAGTLPPEPEVESSDPPKGDSKLGGSGKAKGKKKSTKASPPTPGPPIEEQTYQLAGGWVRITYGEVEVDLDAAGPAPGFTMVISEAGPEMVNITFRSNERASRLRAEWRDGKLVVDIVENPKGQR